MWIKIALQNTDPLTLVTIRVLFALLTLAVVGLFRRTRLALKTHWLKFAVLGLFNVTLPFILISWSEQHIPSALAAILNSTVPLFTILLAHFFVSDDRLTPAKAIGLLVGFGGGIVLVSGKISGEMNLYVVGQVTMLLAALAYAIGAVAARRITVGMTPDAQSLGQLLFAWLMIAPAAMIVEAPFTIPEVPLTLGALAWLGILNTAVATLLFYALLNSVGPTRTTLVTYIFPLVGVMLGVIFLDEALTWRIFIGGGLIISGVVVVNSKIAD